jgi:hypothetical protein
MVTLSDDPVVNEPSTKIPVALLFAVTLLSTPVTTAEPVGLIRIPKSPSFEAIVFETEKLLDVLGEITIPEVLKPRMTQFSIARFPPVLNWMPFVPLPIPVRVRPRR